MKINPTTGIIMDARFVPSPNFNERPSATQIDLVVVHNISLPARKFGGPYIEALFTNTLDITTDPSFADLKDLRVSAHCLIRRNGELTQYVPFTFRAWHAGISSFLGKQNCNDFSIGIELEGADDVPYDQAQYSTLAQLIIELKKIYPKITLDRIVGHSTISPERKTDPGPAFNWNLLFNLLTKNQ